MEYILHINTALEHAMLGISHENVILLEKRNPIQMEHASFVQPAIKEMMDELSIKWQDIKAVSVMNGPGSYTGLRVGLAAAKGICYVWKLPIIPISTLEWLASPFVEGIHDIIIPMIDARRMEVFTAVYSGKMEILEEPNALVLDDDAYAKFLKDENRILFTGNGANKIPSLIRNLKNINVQDSPAGVYEQNILCQKSLSKYDYSEIAYLEPFYLKAFHSTSQSIKK